MDAPPVQYVRTSDGYDIAFSVSGQGRPMIMMPTLFADLMDQWRLPTFRHLFEELSQRFRLIRMDHRGTGMSSRRIDDEFEVAHICRDVDAVADSLQLRSFVLYGGTLAGQAAVLYADAHPERVEALVLWGVAVDKLFSLALIDAELARSSWEMFAEVRQSFFAPFENPADFIGAFTNWMSRDQLFAWARRTQDFTLEPILPRVRTPALVLSRRGPDIGRTREERARQLVSLLPHSKWVEIDAPAIGLFSKDGSTPPAVLAIEDFLSQVPVSSGGHSSTSGSEVLSARELEVLRLIAAGRTNPQIAEALVISANTVAKHVTSILTKTGAANRVEAAVYARDHGLT